MTGFYQHTRLVTGRQGNSDITLLGPGSYPTFCPRFSPRSHNSASELYSASIDTDFIWKENFSFNQFSKCSHCKNCNVRHLRKNWWREKQILSNIYISAGLGGCLLKSWISGEERFAQYNVLQPGNTAGHAYLLTIKRTNTSHSSNTSECRNEKSELVNLRQPF